MLSVKLGNTFPGGDKRTCSPLPSGNHHGKQEVFHREHIGNTQRGTTGLWFSSLSFSFYLCSFPTPNEARWVMTGILGFFLHPEHILFHFPLLLSFLPTEKFSNPFHLWKRHGVAWQGKGKRKNCNLTTLPFPKVKIFERRKMESFILSLAVP